VRRAIALVGLAALVALGLAAPRRPADLRVAGRVHAPVLVVGESRLPPLLVRARRPAKPPAPKPERATAGTPVRVQITAYCLRGLTRSGTEVREGIIAADPRVFPLGSELDLFVGRKLRGRFRVADTGKNIKGARLDLWTSSCSDAIRFGRRRGTAVLVAGGPD
jgi:3D (Asp-Asp-Asp) domain-containing protein